MAPKPTWLYRQSAAIPFLVCGDGIKIVLITSRSRAKWGIPKGVVERSMTPDDSAAKEALEEAGVIGEIVLGWVGDFEYPKWGGVCQVKVFPFRVRELLDDWEEKEARERIVVDLAEAVRMIRPESKEVLVKFESDICRIMESG